MKIIFVNRYFYPDHSATSQMLSDLAFHLAETGWQVEVITSRQRYEDPKAHLRGRETVGNVNVRRVFSTCFGRSNLPGRMLDFISFYFAAFVSMLITTGRDDILVAKTDPPLISVVAAVVARLKTAKLVNWLQDLFPEVAIALNIGGLSGLPLAILRKTRNWSLNTAVTNVVLGDRMRERVIAETGSSGKIQVIHNWADGANIVPVKPGNNTLKAAWGLGEKFVIGYSGNMGRAHQFDTILEIMERLRSDEGIVFLLIGGGAQRNWIQEQVVRRQINNVLIKDYQPRDQLSQSLSVPDLHLITLNPELEGLIVPSKFYGIAAAGRPMLFIGDKNGEVARMIKEADCGAAIEPGDAASATAFIRDVRTSRDNMEFLGKNARMIFSEKFSMQQAFSRWESVLKAVAEA